MVAAITALLVLSLQEQHPPILKLNVPIGREIRAKDVHTFYVALKKGELARVSVIQKGVDLVVRALDTAHHKLVEVDKVQVPTGEEVCEFQAVDGGTYTVEVTPSASSQTGGTYSVALIAELSPVPLVSQRANDPGMTPEEARKTIVELNRQWGKARVELDRPQMEKMLAPDFYVQLYDQKMSRKEFLDTITKPAGMTRFDVEVLTVQWRGDHWSAVITEKLEAEGTGKDGKKHHGYSLWITRDGWKQVGDHWVALYSEAVGNEGWRDTTPPVPHWGP